MPNLYIYGERDGYTHVRQLTPGHSDGGNNNEGLHIVRKADEHSPEVLCKLLSSETDQDDANMLQRVSGHPNIVRFIEKKPAEDDDAVVSEQDDGQQQRVYMEYCAGGSVAELINRYRAPKDGAEIPRVHGAELPMVPEALIWHAFESLARALVHLQYGSLSDAHKTSGKVWTCIVHGDIADDNVLLADVPLEKPETNENPEPKKVPSRTLEGIAQRSPVPPRKRDRHDSESPAQRPPKKRPRPADGASLNCAPTGSIFKHSWNWMTSLPSRIFSGPRIPGDTNASASTPTRPPMIISQPNSALADGARSIDSGASSNVKRSSGDTLSDRISIFNIQKYPRIVLADFGNAREFSGETNYTIDGRSPNVQDIADIVNRVIGYMCFTDEIDTEWRYSDELKKIFDEWKNPTAGVRELLERIVEEKARLEGQGRLVFEELILEGGG